MAKATTGRDRQRGRIGNVMTAAVDKAQPLGGWMKAMNMSGVAWKERVAGSDRRHGGCDDPPVYTINPSVTFSPT